MAKANRTNTRPGPARVCRASRPSTRSAPPPLLHDLLASERLSQFQAPSGMSPATFRSAATHLARQGLCDLIETSHKPHSSNEYRNDDALLRLVRRAFASNNPVDLEALRRLLSFAQAATVKCFHRPELAAARETWIGEPGDDEPMVEDDVGEDEDDE